MAPVGNIYIKQLIGPVKLNLYQLTRLKKNLCVSVFHERFLYTFILIHILCYLYVNLLVEYDCHISVSLVQIYGLILSYCK